MMVAVAASCSYLTPLEPSCLMVYGPGKYQFSDFFKVGMPLTVLIYGIGHRACALGFGQCEQLSGAILNDEAGSAGL